ncbi:MAG: YihY/virulence factor BrkB family protein [Polyangiales bacterium]
MALKITHSIRSGPPGQARPPLRAIWPWQVRGWKRIASVVIDEVKEDRLTIAAAALAFWAMLALFPMLIAIVSLFGLMADPAWIEEGIRQLIGLLPPGGRELLREQLHALVHTPSTSLSLGFLISMVAALWSASSGVDTLVDVMNVAYNKVETRNFFKRRLMSLLMTLALIFFTINAILLVVVLPSLIGWLGPRLDILNVIAVARWPGLAMVVASGLFCLYRYAPARPRPRKSDVTGPLVATVLFLLVSSLFSLYVSEFAAYHKTYGAVGSVVALLFWFYYASLVILLGAELSAELEGEKVQVRDSRNAMRESLLSMPRVPDDEA